MSESRKSALKQFFVFSLMGAIGTAGHYAVLIALVEALSVDPVVASTAGFVVGAIINYLLNYHVTFGSDKPHLDAFAKFGLIALVGAILNGAIMRVAHGALGAHYLVAQVVATGVVLVFNFVLNKVWTFAERTEREG
ncbi:MAG: hypothetical protein AMJ69_06385 [Gammaproteobacteria bacterium SG8_47]|nr:MAG: hypothetical protein AMJ69_06385 [Gammaproteobacteria bacterium SG8_47]